MKNFLAIFIILIVHVSFAEQIFNAHSGQTINATISMRELTRVQVSGEAIVKGFTASNIHIKKDKETGQLYILPGNSKVGFNLFIVDADGNNFNLYLTPSKNQAGDSIVIIPSNNNKSISKLKQPEKTKLNSQYSRDINTLIQTRFINQDGSQSTYYDVMEYNQEVPMWKDIKVILNKQYTNQLLDGNVYIVTNNTISKILLNESKFFNKGVLAVAIEHPNLEVGNSTRVFVIQEHVGG